MISCYLLTSEGSFPLLLQGGTSARFPAVNYAIQKNKTKKCVGANHNQHSPRLVSDIWSERLAKGNDAFAVAVRQHLNYTRKEVVALC